jgi:hypothetical protein
MTSKGGAAASLATTREANQHQQSTLDVARITNLSSATQTRRTSLLSTVVDFT